ncbi:hypothetical protein LEMLEM_LOCUS2223 [Lemmus lemmus]
MPAFVVPSVGFGVRYRLQRHWEQSFFRVLRIVEEDKGAVKTLCSHQSPGFYSSALSADAELLLALLLPPSASLLSVGVKDKEAELMQYLLPETLTWLDYPSVTLRAYLFDGLKAPGRVLLTSRGLGRLGQRLLLEPLNPGEKQCLPLLKDKAFGGQSDSLVTHVEEVNMKCGGTGPCWLPVATGRDRGLCHRAKCWIPFVRMISF